MKKPRRWASSVALLVIGFILAALVTAAPAAAPIVICGMLPSLVVGALDWTDGRSVAVTVGGLNLAGVFPFLPALWRKGMGVVSPIDLLGNTTTLIVMYAAAAAGWLLIALLPALFCVLEREENRHHYDQLRRTQRHLEEEWGQAIAGAETGGGPCRRKRAPG